jgi:glycosyltransferase involved in cell wall biosynthesis
MTKKQQRKLKEILVNEIIKKPSISVIIPANNEEETIEKTINSVQREIYSGNVEIIVACNNCTDTTEERAKAKGARVEVSEKSGMGFGKNLGGKAAENELLLFLDADTRLIPGSLAAIGRAALRFKDIEIIGTMKALLDEPKIIERITFFFVNIIQYLRKLPTPSGAIFITKTLYDKINGFDESIPQGTSSEISLKSVKNGGKWVFLWDAFAITSPRRFRKVGFFKQLFSWVKNVKLLKNNNLEELSRREYEEIR